MPFMRSIPIAAMSKIWVQLIGIMSTYFAVDVFRPDYWRHRSICHQVLHSINFRDSALTRTQEYAGNVIVLRCIPHEAVEVNHDAIQ
jgi:hypothetical protein